MDFSNHSSNLFIAINAAILGGEKIMGVYNSPIVEVEYKLDDSPLTLADKKANTIITEKLKATKIAVLSEEGKNIPYEERKSWKNLWIVDPLDGTKEFVKRNGEFTVNIALIENNFPVLGVIYVPVSRELYFAKKGEGSFKCIIPEEFEAGNLEEILKASAKLSSSPQPEICRIVASRSHMSVDTERYIELKRERYTTVELVSKGSSLKFCLIAENLADCYPRYAPTMEWDTAAGQIIVEEVGKTLVDVKTGERMRYNREELLNNWFLVE
jgi:3'(2'), 5'-bisphosphate nucleotidase